MLSVGNIITVFEDRHAVASALARRGAERTTLRLGLPSKGRMAEDTQQLLKVSHHTANRVKQCLFIHRIHASTHIAGHDPICMGSILYLGCSACVIQVDAFLGTGLATAACRLAGLPAVRLQAQPTPICGDHQSGVTRGVWNASKAESPHSRAGLTLTCTYHQYHQCTSVRVALP